MKKAISVLVTLMVLFSFFPIAAHADVVTATRTAFEIIVDGADSQIEM